MGADLKQHIRSRIANAGKFYAQDLAAMAHDRLAASPGGKARSPYDFTYEVVVVNERIACRLRGEEPPPEDGTEGWIKAPPEFCDPERARQRLEESTAGVLAAWDGLPVERLGETAGSMTCLDLGSLCATHMMYHDAQLNMLQAIDGDAEVHWS